MYDMAQQQSSKHELIGLNDNNGQDLYTTPGKMQHLNTELPNMKAISTNKIHSVPPSQWLDESKAKIIAEKRE
jgi:hypothetical protein